MEIREGVEGSDGRGKLGAAGITVTTRQLLVGRSEEGNSKEARYTMTARNGRRRRR